MWPLHPHCGIVEGGGTYSQSPQGDGSHQDWVSFLRGSLK